MYILKQRIVLLRKLTVQEPDQSAGCLIYIYYIEPFIKYNYNKAMRKLAAKLMVVLVPVLCIMSVIVSCSKSQPRILYGFIDLVYYQGKDKPEERYSFFVLPEDDDGIENLSELYVYNDRQGLRWHISSDDWVQYQEDGKTWVGSRGIAMAGNAPLPRGQYRAVLVNKGGERTERSFTYDGPEDSPYPFPFFSISSGIYRIDSRYPVNHLICYDQQGKAVQTLSVTEIQGNISDLRLANSVRTIALWADDPEYHISALTDAAARQ